MFQVKQNFKLGQFMPLLSFYTPYMCFYTFGSLIRSWLEKDTNGIKRTFYLTEFVSNESQKGDSQYEIWHFSNIYKYCVSFKA